MTFDVFFGIEEGREYGSRDERVEPVPANAPKPLRRRDRGLPCHRRHL